MRASLLGVTVRALEGTQGRALPVGCAGDAAQLGSCTVSALRLPPLGPGGPGLAT